MKICSWSLLQRRQGNRYEKCQSWPDAYCRASYKPPRQMQCSSFSRVKARDWIKELCQIKGLELSLAFSLLFDLHNTMLGQRGMGLQRDQKESTNVRKKPILFLYIYICCYVTKSVEENWKASSSQGKQGLGFQILIYLEKAAAT